MRFDGISSARVVSLLTLTGLACAPLHAQGTRASLTDPGAADAPRSAVGALPAQRSSGLAPLAAPDLSSRFGAVSRGTDGAMCPTGLGTMESGFESLAPVPATLAGQLDVVTWGGAASCVTGRNFFSAPTVGWLASEIGAHTAAALGNATQTIGAIIEDANAPGEFFGRWARYDFYRVNTASPTQAGATRFSFIPVSGQDVRVGHDVYVTSIDSLWASEPTGVTIGFVAARFLWGGENVTSGIGLPVGPIPDFYTLGPANSVFMAEFMPCRIPRFYRSGQPFPGWNGADPLNDPTQRVPVPVGRWFRIIHETTFDGRLRHVLDLYDGAGEFVVFDGPALQTLGPSVVDRIAWSGTKETLGDAMYVDNVRAEGHRQCDGCPGDATHDCRVDFADLNLVLSNFGMSVLGWFTGDLNGDNEVNFADLNIVLSAFGTEC